MLVSTRVDPHELFANLQAVVVDELHAFAGDDRGWHLLAVLERLQRVAGRPIQRVGLSATVGNPDELMQWLQGSGAGGRPSTVLAPEAAPSGSAIEVGLDYVGSTDNAATVIAALHRGEKRLVFCESRRQVEELSVALRTREVETFVSHSSLSLDERRRSETAFAEARDCVIVSTSTLELGIDVGDLDRMIQIDSPRTVASFLQRLGRTGRRDGTSRNALFLTTTGRSLVQAAGLLRLWAQGWVEPVTPPPSPRHLIAQQVLALCLQEKAVGDQTWPSWWAGLHAWKDSDAHEIVDWLTATGHLDLDSGMLFIGTEAEKRYGRRHFMDLVSVFTADPELVVFAGNREIGRIDPGLLLEREEGPRFLSLAGHAWRITHVDWRRRKCWVEPAGQGTRMRWASQGQPLSFALCQSRRAVLVGEDPPVTLSARAVRALIDERSRSASHVRPDRTVIDDAGYWWTYAGARANATIAAALPDVIAHDSRGDNDRVRLRDDVPDNALSQAIAALDPLAVPLPHVNENALRELKFAESLPPALAVRTLAERIVDVEGMRAVLGEPRTIVHTERALRRTALSAVVSSPNIEITKARQEPESPETTNARVYPRWPVLTRSLDDAASPIRREIDQVLRPDAVRTIRNSYRSLVGTLKVDSSGANGGTVGTAFDTALKLLIDPTPNLGDALAGAANVGQPAFLAFRVLIDLLGATATPRGDRVPGADPIGAPLQVRRQDPDLPVRASWALALATEVYRSGAIHPASPLVEYLRAEHTPDVDGLLSLATPPAVAEVLVAGPREVIQGL